jgi:hypothetical protein
MNMLDEPQDVVFTTTYEFIPLVPESFALTTPYWLDIGGCKTSSFPAERDAVFKYTAPTWTSSHTGAIVFVGGHLHDGGTTLEVVKNSQVICETKAEYDMYHSPSPSVSNEHISKISTCADVGSTVPGDKWTVVANYNTSLRTPMARMDGTLEEVMGISLVYVAQNHAAPGENGRAIGYLGVTIVTTAVMLALLLFYTWLRRRGYMTTQLSRSFSKWWRRGDGDSESNVPLLADERELHTDARRPNNLRLW